MFIEKWIKLLAERINVLAEINKETDLIAEGRCVICTAFLEDDDEFICKKCSIKDKELQGE